MEVSKPKDAECVFTLSRPEHTYFIDEIICGSVKLTTFKTEIVQEISVILHGQINVKFKSRRHRGLCTQEETIMTVPFKVADECILQPGEHIYEFSLQPDAMGPTSLKGKYGSVSYELRFVLRGEGEFSNSFKTPVYLIRSFNLNLYPMYNIPQESDGPTACNCWGILGPKMFCTIKTPYSAYAPGQTVICTIETQNVPLDGILRVSVQFSKIMKFCATHPASEHVEMETSLIYQTSIIESLLDNIIEDKFRIPATPPTSTRDDQITVKYVLTAEVIFSICRCHRLVAEVPIVIGTSPIRESLGLTRESQNPHRLSATIPPPTFEVDFDYDSSLLNVLKRKSDNEFDDCPRYPVYKIPRAGDEASDESALTASDEL